MARKFNILKDKNSKDGNILPKYNYGTGAGWCVKKNKGKAKQHYKSGGHQK
jgi:hypothetical protein